MTSSTLRSSPLPCCPSAPCPAQALRKAAARSGGARGGLRAPSAVPAGSEPPGKGSWGRAGTDPGPYNSLCSPARVCLCPLPCCAPGTPAPAGPLLPRGWGRAAAGKLSLSHGCSSIGGFLCLVQVAEFKKRCSEPEKHLWVVPLGKGAWCQGRDGAREGVVSLGNTGATLQSCF